MPARVIHTLHTVREHIRPLGGEPHEEPATEVRHERQMVGLCEIYVGKIAPLHPLRCRRKDLRVALAFTRMIHCAKPHGRDVDLVRHCDRGEIGLRPAVGEQQIIRRGNIPPPLRQPRDRRGRLVREHDIKDAAHAESPVADVR